MGLEVDASDTTPGLQTFATAVGPEAAADLPIAGARTGAVFGTISGSGTYGNYSNEISDLVGVDISIGATDEDITYIGQRSVLKAEIKKETTVTLTRKKSTGVLTSVLVSVIPAPASCSLGWLTGNTSLGLKYQPKCQEYKFLKKSKF